MKKSGKKLNKKQLTILFSVLVVLFLIVLVTTFPNFYKQSKVNNTDSESETTEIPKLKIMDLNSTTRPVAVMINNIGTARKYHRGLQDAYLVYEMIVEGGITRLMALYKDQNTAKIGSIRSARHYYLDYVLENDAIYVHWGYSEYARDDISKLGINNINGLTYGNTYFFRDKSLKVASEHTGYSSMELINNGISKLGYRNTMNTTPLLNYSIEPVDIHTKEGSIEAKNVSISYSRSAITSYTYDEELKLYKRSVNGTPHTDYDTKEVYTAKNIITYKVKNSTIVGDTKGRQNLSNIGSGTGYYITEGYAIPILWEKASRSAKTVYKLQDGTILNVNDGNTFIQIQPEGQSLTIS